MSDTPNTTLKPTITQQLAVEIHVTIGAQAQAIQVPVADAAEALALQKHIQKTTGKLMLGADTDAPMLIDCRFVPFTRVVLLEPKTEFQPPKLARLQ